MSIWGIIPELPLLRRELTELSSRRRTYVIRFVGAIIVLTAVMLYFNYQVAMLESSGYGVGSGNPNRFVGVGASIFKGIVPMLFVSVQLLMPALICGSITIEKERNTIGTLFVTRLSPMTIVLEKLGSRLVPMFTFLLLTFPVLAVVLRMSAVCQHRIAVQFMVRHHGDGIYLVVWIDRITGRIFQLICPRSPVGIADAVLSVDRRIPGI